MTFSVKIEGADKFYSDVRSDINSLLKKDPKISFEDLIDELNIRGRFNFNNNQIVKKEQLDDLKNDEGLRRIFDEMPKTGWQKAGRVAEDFGRWTITIASGIAAFVLNVLFHVEVSRSFASPIVGAAVANHLVPGYDGLDFTRERRRFDHALLKEVEKHVREEDGIEYKGDSKRVDKKSGTSMLKSMKNKFFGNSRGR